MATKLKVKLGAGHPNSTAEHEIEIGSPASGADAGETHCRLDSESPIRANWVRIAPGRYSILLGNRSYEVHVTPAPGADGAREYSVKVGSDLYRVELHDPRAWKGHRASEHKGPQDVSAPMPGKVVKVLVDEGDEVQDGQGLLVIEAMKMQNELRSPRAGRVERIYATEGAGVETGAPLVRLASL